MICSFPTHCAELLLRKKYKRRIMMRVEYTNNIGRERKEEEEGRRRSRGERKLVS